MIRPEPTRRLLGEIGHGRARVGGSKEMAEDAAASHAAGRVQLNPLWAALSTASGVVADTHGAGRPLEQPTLNAMQARMGADLSGVRVHDDEAAAASAEALGARAFTGGTHVVFGRGLYQPAWPAGQTLLAHELAHVVDGHTASDVLRRQTAGAEPPGAEGRSAGLTQAEWASLSDDAKAAWASLSGDAKAAWASLSGDVKAALAEQLAVIQEQIAASESEDRPEAAHQERALLLVQFTHPAPFADRDAVIEFVADCDLDAVKEPVTLAKLGKDAPQAVIQHPQAFPQTWADQLALTLDLGLDEATFAGEKQRRGEWLLQLGALVPGLVSENGLPVNLAEIGGLKSFELKPEHARLPEADIVRDFAQAALAYRGSAMGIEMVRWWKRVLLHDLVENVRSGEETIDPAEIAKITGAKGKFTEFLNSGMAPGEDQFRELDAEVAKLQELAMLTAIISVAAGFHAAGQLWQDASALFKAKLAEADAIVASWGVAETLKHAFFYQITRNYVADQFLLIAHAVWNNKGEILQKMLLFMGLQAVPGVNVLVDLYLIWEMGSDLVEALWDLGRAFKDAATAHSVIELQQGSARLARALMTAPMRILMDYFGLKATMAHLKASVAKLLADNPGMSPRDAAKIAVREAAAKPPAKTTEPAGEPPAKTTEPAGEPPAKTTEPTKSPFPSSRSRKGGVKAPRPPAGTSSAGVTGETVAVFKRRPDLKRALERGERAAQALRRCASSCYPEFASPSQIDRLDRMLEAAEDAGEYYDPEGLTSYLRGTKSWTELEEAIDTLAKDIERKIGVKGAFTEAAGPYAEAPTLAGRPATKVLRGQPGVVTGGGTAATGGRVFPREKGIIDYRVAPIPGRIAARMRGMPFENFDACRETLWQMMADDPLLRADFDYYPENLDRMRNGLAPWPPGEKIQKAAGIKPTRVETTGRGPNAVYNLNHRLALKNTGDVYDLDNLEIATPKTHGEIGD